MRSLLIGAAAAGLIASGAQAETAETTKDIRCVVIYSYLIGTSDDDADKRSLAIGMFYYQGRIDGREPALDYGTALKREMLNIPDEAIEPELKRCSAGLQDRSGEMEVVGKRVEAEVKP
ncbi:hypothetical protein BH11PSE1_BH11PSE1_16290 [soil metagenome]